MFATPTMECAPGWEWVCEAAASGTPPPTDLYYYPEVGCYYDSVFGAVGPDCPPDCVVTAWGLNVRAGPGTEYPVLFVVGQGTQLVATAESDGWLGVVKVNPDGTWQAGWVAAEYCQPLW